MALLLGGGSVEFLMAVLLVAQAADGNTVPDCTSSEEGWAVLELGSGSSLCRGITSVGVLGDATTFGVKSGEGTLPCTMGGDCGNPSVDMPSQSASVTISASASAGAGREPWCGC